MNTEESPHQLAMAQPHQAHKKKKKRIWGSGCKLINKIYLFSICLQLTSAFGQEWASGHYKYKQGKYFITSGNTQWLNHGPCLLSLL